MESNSITLLGVTFTMDISLGNVAVALTVAGTLMWGIRRIMQFLELLLKTILWAARQMGEENVPDWLASQYKAINGNAKASKEEKADVLGPRHETEDNAMAAGEGK